MKLEEIRTDGYQQLLESFISYLQDKKYNSSTLLSYQRTLTCIDKYMQSNQITAYTESVGNSYLNEFILKSNCQIARINAIRTSISRLNNFLRGSPFVIQQQYKAPSLLPTEFEKVLDSYSNACKELGNKGITIKKKTSQIRCFLFHCISFGCESLSELSPNQLAKSCLSVTNKDDWAVIRDFLRFICKANIINADFSPLVPYHRRSFHLPTTYSEIDISKIEQFVDRNTVIGKRNYAMLLFATRLGMRSGDIAKLTFEEIDFDNNQVHFIQQKTGECLQLPLLMDVKHALKDYITNARPSVDDPKVFLRTIAPYRPVTTSVLCFETAKYFKLAGIDIAGKKHGPHTFRSSLANSMVNGGTPYEVVCSILGHSDPDAIKHYAKLNIELLRKCSIPVPPPSGTFSSWLKGV